MITNFRFFKMLLCLSYINFTLWSLPSYSGQGRDGTWLKSINTLDKIIADLKNRAEKISAEDLKFSLNNMQDREEYIKVTDLNLKLFKKLLRSVEIPNVANLSQKKGNNLKLFDYDNSEPYSPSVFATLAYYANPKFQVDYKQMPLKTIKEVQTLILREISHLWGFGEEGAIDYPTAFAKRMISRMYARKYSSRPFYSINEKFKSQMQKIPKMAQNISNLICYDVNWNNSYEKDDSTYNLNHLLTANEKSRYYLVHSRGGFDASLAIFVFKDSNLQYKVCHQSEKYIKDFISQF